MKQYNLSILILRPLLILSIIIGHGFAIYSGSWEMPSEIADVNSYQYVNNLFISFQLQCFVFISGFLFGKSDTKLNINIRKRFKRIMYPSIFWSVIYAILFERENITNINYFCHFFTGNGHLWFLPMLFGCYLIAILLRRLKLHSIVIFTLALIMMLFSFPLPYPLSILISIASFYIYYEMGIYISKVSINNYHQISFHITYILIPLFVLLFVLYIEQIDEFKYIYTTIAKLHYYIVFNILKFMISITGISLSFLLLHKIEKYFAKHLSILIKLNSFCFPVYIFHQFIMWYILYDTTLISDLYINPYVVPFFIITISLIASIITTIIFKKIAHFKILIGC